MTQAGGHDTEKSGGRLSSPAATRTPSITIRYYLLQQPDPQQPSRSTFAPAVGHSSTQHSQVHVTHVQVPVSQQPQQSHWGQPTFRLPSIADTKGTRPSVAQRKKLFMGNLPLHRETESIAPRHDV